MIKKSVTLFNELLVILRFFFCSSRDFVVRKFHCIWITQFTVSHVTSPFSFVPNTAYIVMYRILYIIIFCRFGTAACTKFIIFSSLVQLISNEHCAVYTFIYNTKCPQILNDDC